MNKEKATDAGNERNQSQHQQQRMKLPPPLSIINKDQVTAVSVDNEKRKSQHRQRQWGAKPPTKLVITVPNEDKSNATNDNEMNLA